MYCVRAVTKDLYWVGGNDRRLAMFEGVYSVPDGVSYNSYLLLDEKTVLFDRSVQISTPMVRSYAERWSKDSACRPGISTTAWGSPGSPSST